MDYFIKDAEQVRNDIIKELWTQNEERRMKENRPIYYDTCIKVSKEYWDNENVQVIIVPDISSVNFGRGVGYDIIEHIPPPEVAQISATKIREQMKLEGKLWRRLKHFK